MIHKTVDFVLDLGCDVSNDDVMSAIWRTLVGIIANQIPRDF